MCRKVVFPLLLTIALSQAGVVPLNALDYLEGPSTKTKVIGPDGSIIDAYLPGGRISLNNLDAPLIQTLPIVLASAAVSGHDAHALSYHNFIAEQPTSLNTGTHALRYQNVIANEPSFNTIETNAAVTQRAAGSLTEIGSVTPTPLASIKYDGTSEPKVVLLPGTLPRFETRDSVPVTEATDETTDETTEFTTTEGTTIASNEVNAYFSGRYVADNFESLYDDGSYRVEHY